MTVAERQGTGAVSGDSQSASVQFWITEQTTWAAAYNELYAETVGGGTYASFNGIPAQSCNVAEVSERLGYWNGTAQYSFDTPRSTNPSTSSDPKLEFSFDTTVRPVLEKWGPDGTGWRYASNDKSIGDEDDLPNNLDIFVASGETKVDHDGLAPDSEKGFQGIQVLRPSTTFYLQYTPATLSQSQLVAISKSVGKVNSDTFYGYEPGEVLFTGCRGQSKLNDRWRLSYEFEAKENRDTIDIGNGISIQTATQGWDVIEVEMKRTTIDIPGPPARKKTLQRARQARRLRPFERIAFNTTLFPV